MIVKFFKSRQGGSAKASIDYLRGKDQEREQATVLKGNPDLSQSIAESLEFKNNYTVGCLSFEEPDLSMEHKREIMEKFEKTFFAGLDDSQYNITWIEHRDKGRLELNYFIPNVELDTNKRLQPYYDKADRHLADNFKKVINHEYGLTNPDDPSKSQLLKHNLRTPKPVKEIKEGITLLVSKHIEQGTIKSQEQLAELLTKSGLEISRVTKNSISIKNPSGARNIRLDGEIYKKEFYEQTRTIEEFRKNFGSGKSDPRYGNSEDSERDYKHAKEQLRIGVERRTERHQELYGKSNILDIDSIGFDRSCAFSSDRRSDLWEEVKEPDRGIESNESVIRTIRTIYENKRDRNTQRGRGEQRENLLHQQEQKSTSLRIKERLQSNEHRGIKGIIDELSRRTQSIIERTEKTLFDVRERAKKVFEFVRGVRDRESKIESSIENIRNYSEKLHDSDSKFRERIGGREEIAVFRRESINERINESAQGMERISGEFKLREQQTTSIDRKINRKSKEIDRGFSMGR